MANIPRACARSSLRKIGRVCNPPAPRRSAELADRLIKKGVNPDKLAYEALVAELTNHLIPDVVLTPGVVATLPLLQEAGFHYAK